MSKLTIVILSVLATMLLVNGVVAAETTTAVNAEPTSVDRVSGVSTIKVSPSTTAAASGGANVKSRPVVAGSAFAKPIIVDSGNGQEDKVLTVTTTANEVIPIYKTGRTTTKEAVNAVGISGQNLAETGADIQGSAIAAVYVRPVEVAKVINFGGKQIEVPRFFPFAKKAVVLQLIDAEGNEISEKTIRVGGQETFSGINIKIVSATSASDIQLKIGGAG